MPDAQHDTIHDAASAPTSAVRFDSKVALVIRSDLAVWQKLNVAAFLATGIAAAVPEAVGEPYVDAAGRAYGRMLGQPVMIFAADRAGLQSVQREAAARGLTMVPYVAAMFATGHDAANRAVFAAENPEDADWVGLALHGPRKAVDKAVKGLALHG
ncbi:hypothetical protein J2847_003279 [Azospirillum agricola]|uniref:DUF2000 domain-containing protein n=1 Tax=Azospirillum agricola TaxID=1720247 RepID=UPI001AE6D76C|nr:DUF2000 domain-containing protein [Azospirillum agricola]MBP2229976.1 hypothetical protein [Azospirillum agricola]